jgi:hypothetical protein
MRVSSFIQNSRFGTFLWYSQVEVLLLLCFPVASFS